jgi:curved DNA-binding protein CbpA
MNSNIGQLKDYYAILGVPQTATISEVHKAYWQNASSCHPDRGGSHEAMVQLVEAWEILSEPDK